MIKGYKPIAGFLGLCAVVLGLALAPAFLGGDRALAQIEGRTVEQPSPTAGNVPAAIWEPGATPRFGARCVTACRAACRSPTSGPA